MSEKISQFDLQNLNLSKFSDDKKINNDPIIENNELQKPVIETLVNLLGNYKEKIKNQEMVKQKFIELISFGQTNKANKLIKNLEAELSDEFIQDVIRKEIIYCLSEYNNILGVINLLKYIELKLDDKFFQNPEIQDAFKKYIISSRDPINTAIDVLRTPELKLNDKFFQNPEIQDAFKKSIISSGCFFSSLIDVLRTPELKLDDKFFQNSETQDAFKKYIISSRDPINTAIDALRTPELKLDDKFFQNPEIQDAFFKSVYSFATRDSIDYFIKLVNSHEIYIGREVIIEFAKKLVISDLRYNGNTDYSKKLITQLNLSDNEIQEVGKQIIVEEGSLGKNSDSDFKLDDKIIYDALKQRAINLLKSARGPDCLEFKEIIQKYDFLQSPEVQEAIDQWFISKSVEDGAYETLDEMTREDYGRKIPIIMPRKEAVRTGLKQDIIKKLSEDQFEIVRGMIDGEGPGRLGDGIYNPELKVANEELEEIFKLGDAKAKFFLKETFPDNYSDYLKNINNIAFNEENSFLERKSAIKDLIDLALSGENVNLEYKFAELIQGHSMEKEALKSAWNLDTMQKMVFDGLTQLDNIKSNTALWSLLDNFNINTTVKCATLKILSDEKRNFLSSKCRKALKEWLHSKKTNQELDWRDLSFIKSILNDIPSTELREKSQTHIDVAIHNLSIDGLGVYQVWQEHYNQIPKNAFFQLYKFCNGDEELMGKFQELYYVLKKENTKKDNLLYGIVNALEIDAEILKMITGKLQMVAFGEKSLADDLSELFRQIVFLNKYDNKYDNKKEVAKIFSQNISSLNELTVLMREVITKKIQEILPHEDITAEKVEMIEKSWGNLEPIFTYLGRYPQLKEYVAEMVVNFDSAEDWKNWRYDPNNRDVKNQIGHLSAEQAEIWKNDYFVEIGDLEVSDSAVDKPQRIGNILKDAVVTHRHIFNPEEKQNKNEFVQKTIEGYFTAVAKEPNRTGEIYKQEELKIQNESGIVDVIIDHANLPRLQQSLEEIIPQDQTIKINKKVRDTIGFISKFLPRENVKEITDKIKDKKDGDDVASNDLIPAELRGIVSEKTKQIENDYAKTLESDIWEKHNLDKNNLKNLAQFYQKRQELKATIDLLRLSNLSNRLIATNKIVEKEGKKGGEALTTVIENLKKYFKDSALLQDIKNIEFALREKSDFGEKRKLAVIFTDNSQVMWQVGKYPLGCGSCQNYAEGSHASCLMGYVGDANCKALYLIDLNKLPQAVRERINENGFNEIKNSIHYQDILEASLARSIVKMTKDAKDEPVVLIEPTYTVINKGDDSMDKYFNIFTSILIAEPGNLKTARGGGNESVSKGRSRSPQGQYEDLNLNSVRFIKKTSKKTKEDLEIEDRVKSSR